MRITIESDIADQPVSVTGAGQEEGAAPQAIDAGAAPVGLTASGGLVQEPPAFTVLPPQAGADAALSAGPAPAEEEVGP